MKPQITSLVAGVFGLLITSLTGFAHGAEFKPAFVDSLVPGYLAVQSALANDDLAGAKSAAAALVDTAKHGPKFTAFTTPASALAGAEDLASARSSFLTVTMEMQDLIDHVGTTGEQTLYEVHCPMALAGKGGSWLQGDQNVHNPYFGSMMLRCGSVKGQVAGPPAHDEH